SGRGSQGPLRCRHYRRAGRRLARQLQAPGANACRSLVDRSVSTVTLALSLRDKLLTMWMVTSGPAVMLASGASFVYDSRNMLRVMSEDLGSLADVAGANSVAAMAFGDVTASKEILAALALKPGVNAAALYAKDGVLFTSFQRSKASAEWIPSHVPIPVIAGNRTTVVRPIMFAGEVAGFIYISSD